MRLLVILSLPLGLMACDGISPDVAHIERAETYFERGDIEEAATELKNALEKDQNNGRARLLLGKVLLALGDLLGAEKEFVRAEVLGVSEDEIYPSLAEVMLGLNKQRNLLHLSVSRIANEEARARVLAAQGTANLELRDLRAAGDRINEAVALAPDSVYVIVAKARYLVTTELLDLARAELDRAFELDPEYAPAWSLLGDLESVAGNLEVAETAYARAVETRRNNFPDRLKLAKTRLDRENFEQAEAELRELLILFPDHPGVNYAQGLVDFHLKRDAEARNAFGKATRAKNFPIDTLFYLAVTNWNLGNQELAQKYGYFYLARAPRSIRGHKLMASMEMAKGRYNVVEELIRPVVQVRKDDPVALDLLVDALMKQQRIEEALPWMRQRIELDPESVAHRLTLAAALARLGQSSESRTHIERALETNPADPAANRALVLHHLSRNAREAARQAAGKWVENSPQGSTSLNLLGRLNLLVGDRLAAKAAFERALEAAPGNANAGYALASLAIEAKDYDAARGHYQALLENGADERATEMRLALLDVLEKKHEQMVGRVEGLISRYPEDLQPRTLLAKFYLHSGQPEKVPPLMMLNLSDKQKRHPEVLELLGISHLAMEQYMLAKSNLKKLTQLQPRSAQAHFLLAKAWSGLGNAFFLREALERTVALAPGHFDVRLALATLLLKERRAQQAMEHIAILDQLSPEHPDVLRLKVLQARLVGDQERVLALLEAQFEKAFNTRSMLELASQRWALGERETVLAMQEQWLEEHPEDLVASLALAEAYVRAGRTDSALERYQMSLKLDPRNVAALNEIAWLLREREPPVALEYAREANRLAPDVAHVIDTLAVMQLRNGDLSGALVNIDNALGRAPQNPAIRYHKALIDAENGRHADARRALEKLLADENVQFTEKEAAVALLERLRTGP